jgi:hypothetical protein
MTWRTYYVLEILSFAGIIAVLNPQTLKRFFVSAVLINLFAVFYHRRVKMQKS